LYKRARLAALALTVLLTAASFCMTLGIGPAADAMMAPPPAIAAKSAKLVDASTGQVLYAADSDERTAPASITKIMTMLLVMEQVKAGKISLDDVVAVSTEASLMGGSQVYLKERERVPVRDLMAAAAIRSANDASFALAEHVAGTADDFVWMMNQRAAELGMANTHFTNPEGLDDPDHYTTAADIAIMSRELVAYPEVLEWTSTWIGKMRDGTYDLFNTNRLIKEYEGADGLKTGHTDKAGYCLAGTAERGGVRLIAVVMGTAGESERVAETAKLLDYGFRNFERATLAEAGAPVGTLRVQTAARPDVAAVAAEDVVALVPRGTAAEVSVEFEPVEEEIAAPIKKGQTLGRAVVRTAAGEELRSVSAVAESDVARANMLVRAWRSIVGFFARLLGRK
jgi:D-alanyl-D-alanine carboxypeptidase (penicillin-binding protein 5/6)